MGVAHRSSARGSLIGTGVTCCLIILSPLDAIECWSEEDTHTHTLEPEYSRRTSSPL